MASQYEKEKQAKREQALAKKSKADAIVQTAETVAILKPKTFKEKLQNYWYHYKIPTLIGALVVIFVVSLLWNILSKPKYDASFTIVSETSYDGSQSFLKEKLDSLLVDNNNDGKKLVNLEAIMISVGENAGASADVIQMNRTKLIAKLTKNDSFLFMVDSACYQDLKDFGISFKDLSTISDSKRVDGEKYSLKQSNFATKLGMTNMLDDTYLCLIDFDQFDEKDKDKKSYRQAYENDKKLLESIIQYN